jgi:hypothetical protein
MLTWLHYKKTNVNVNVKFLQSLLIYKCAGGGLGALPERAVGV